MTKSATRLPATAFTGAARQTETDRENAVGAAFRAPAGTAAEQQAVPHALDLSAKTKLLLLPGRGKVGKTLLLRWMAERAALADRPVVLADLDRTNASLASYFEGVARPEYGDDATVRTFIERLLEHVAQEKTSAAVDLGGGDTVLPRLASEVPDLADAMRAEGVEPVMFCVIGPEEEDLGPLQTLMSAGFKPRATCIVLNEGQIKTGQAREDAFRHTTRHSTFRAAVEGGAALVWMPRLHGDASPVIERRRITFNAAANPTKDDIEARRALGWIARGQVRRWLSDMEVSFSEVASWMP